MASSRIQPLLALEITKAGGATSDWMRRARSRRLMGVRSLAVTCEVCHHEAVLSADGWGDAVLLRALRPRMVCIVCGIVGADARPNRREMKASGNWRAGPVVTIWDTRPNSRTLLATADVPARAGNGEAFVHLRGRDGLRGRNKRGKRRAGRAYRFGPTEGYWEAFP